MDQSKSLKTEEVITHDTNIATMLGRYLRHWRWLLVTLVLSLLGGLIVINYQTPLYEVSGTILIKDDKKGGALSELSAFEDLGLLQKTSNIDNEIELLKSRALMTLVARELRLNIYYFISSGLTEKEKFSDAPIYLRFPDGDSTAFDLKTDFRIVPESAQSFKLKDNYKKLVGSFRFGQLFHYAGHNMMILAQTDLAKEGYIDKEIHVYVSPLDKVIDDYRKAIKIDPVNKTSNVIAITLKDRVKQKAAAIVDNLVQQHNLDAIADKNQVSKNTADFINERIKYITGELSEVESEAELFKTTHGLVDVESEAKLFLQTGSESEEGIVEVSTQKALADYMTEYIRTHTSASDLIPANLGLEDNAVTSTIVEYNKLVLERNRILRNSSEKNPVVESMTEQLIGIRKNINESLNNYQAALRIKLTELSKQEKGINSKIATVPSYERQYRIIQRQQQIKETLYLYLLQKREETNIALAVTVANTKIIDKAHGSDEPVSPKRKIIFLVAFLAGVGIFVLIIYVINALDNKVHGKNEIERLGIPFLGDIPLSSVKTKVVVAKGENTSVAEAFRLLRTNVDFILPKAEGHGRTVFLTSTVGKEGKSFIALNLAASLAVSGKKTLLIGMDIRAPKILQYLDLEDRPGLTAFLSDHHSQLQQFIVKDNRIKGLDILPSGAIPPNPAELLMNERVGELFDLVKQQYDYIIVDTAPVGMVTDTLLLSKYADAFIYVVRAHYLDKRLLTVAAELYKNKRLPNMAVMLNGTDITKGYGYGYGYGAYGYGETHK